MSSVLVVIVLLGMWAFVLVPLVRQRSVKADEARSVARFSSALRVLSRGHSVGAARSSGWGHRQWVMPPREGLANVRQRRLASRAAGAARPTAAALRRRQLVIGLAAAVTCTLLLVLVAGRSFVLLQVVADFAFAAGIFVCRWSVAQEQAVVSRGRRRRETVELRTSLRHASLDEESLGDLRAAAPDEVPVMTVPLYATVPTMTVPLDAPVSPRRAAPNQAADPVPVAPAAQAQHPGMRRSPMRPEDVPAAARRVSPPRPRAEPVVLAEIDLDWEPAVPEPSSCVRLIDLSTRSRRSPIFDESPADGVDVGDDAELDALVQRRLAASGW